MRGRRELWDWRSLGCITAALVGVARGKPHALGLTPSTQWYGDDGRWSAISVRIGSPEQWVDLIPSTISSETWVVSPFGCSDNNSLCVSERGGIFTAAKSSTWHPEDFYGLDLDKQLGMKGYGSYGLDDLEFGTTGVLLPNALIAAINDTTYWVPFFGLGIVPGSFNGTDIKSALSGLVETSGTIPSHSYGFTAGAAYQQKMDPLSLTLGGYDSSRFVAHDTSFTLNPSQQPQVYLNSIGVASTQGSSNWTTPVPLLNAADAVSAIIDSTTPFLWFPQSVCDKIAQSLGLTYNETLALYTYDADPAQHDRLKMASLNFTFGLSNLASSTKIVNITLPYAAFDLEATYPFLNDTSYGSYNSTKYYFPLKVATSEAQYTIGRSFLQEAYIITDYERNNFSVHQAIHTGEALGVTSLISIEPYDKSTFSGYPSSANHKLSPGAVAGIAVGIVIICVLGTFAGYWFWQRGRPTIDDVSEKLLKHGFLDRFRLRSRPSESSGYYETNGSSTFPTEVGADVTHQRFELPAPLGPVELESDSNTLSGTTENGSTLDAPNISAYERHRRKIEHQQAVALYRGLYSSEEKTEDDRSLVAHYRSHEPSENGDTPLVSPVGPPSGSGGSLPSRSGQPSPVTPHAPLHTVPRPPPTYKRVKATDVTYAGSLPGNVRLPSNPPSVSRDNDPNTDFHISTLALHNDEEDGQPQTANDIHSISSPSRSPTSSNISARDRKLSTSNSNISVLDTNNLQDREADDTKFLLGDMLKMKSELKAKKGGTRLMGEDFIHVPQPNENRFSWQVEDGRRRKQAGS